MKLIKVSAEGCMACILMEERMREVRPELIENLDVISYDYDMDETEVEPLDVGTTFPVLILESDGIEVGRLVGEKSDHELEEFLRDGQERA